MRFPNSLAFKNAIVYFGLFLVGFGLLGFLLLYYSSKEIILGEEQSIEQSADLIELKVQEHISALKQDIKFLSSGPLLLEFFETQDSSTLEYIQLEFLSLLNAKNDYDQIRFISAVQNGKELVRVDRKGKQTSIVPEDSLQVKGDRGYYQAAISLPEDELYFSPIDLNKEFGKISTPITPTIRAAYPVYYNQVAQGIVIVNMNLTKLFQSLSQIVSENAQLRIVNEDGFYLYHENIDSTFLFEYNKDPNIDPSQLVESMSDFQTSNEKIQYQSKLQIPDIDYSLHLVMVSDKGKLLENYYSWRRTSLLFMALLALLFMFLSFLILRRQSNTLTEITKNLLQFPNTLKTENLPTRRKDEIGQLASGFEQMSNMISQNMKSLEDAKKVAQQAVNDKDEFIENFSHEIRNPLQSIIGLCHVLDQNNPTPAQSNIINSLKFNTSNLNILINDILDYKKVVDNQITFNFDWVNLSNFIDELFKSNQYFALSKQLHFTYKIEDQLQSKSIHTDALRLSQILNNLITNAIKFTPQKGKIHLKISQNDQSKVRFALTNSGDPLSQEEIQKIQERYYRSEDTNAPQSGHGIGLSIVQGLLNQFGSKLEISAKETTCFAFDLPSEFQEVQSNDSAKISKTEQTEERLPPIFELESISILIVEDDRQILHLYKHLFEKNKNQIQYVYALEEIDEINRKFDLIILDSKIGETSIFTKDEQIQSCMNENSIVYLVTGQTPDNQTFYSKITLDRIINKPFESQFLLKALKEDYYDKNFGQPNFTSIINDYDQKEEKYMRAIKLLLKEWKNMKNKLVKAIQRKDVSEFHAIQHKIITSIRRLELNRFESMLSSLNIENKSKDELETQSFRIDCIMQHYIDKIQDFIKNPT